MYKKYWEKKINNKNIYLNRRFNFNILFYFIYFINVLLKKMKYMNLYKIDVYLKFIWLLNVVVFFGLIYFYKIIYNYMIIFFSYVLYLFYKIWINIYFCVFKV